MSEKLEFNTPIIETEALKEAQAKIKELVNKTYAAKLMASKAEGEYKKLKGELVELMQSTDTDKIMGDDATATCKLKASITVPKEINSKKELFKYIMENHGATVLDDMLTINARTFGAWYTKEIEAHVQNGNKAEEFELNDIITPYEYYSVDFRKRAKK